MKQILQVLSLVFISGCGKISSEKVINDKPQEIFFIPESLDNFAVIYEAEKNMSFNKDVIYTIPESGILMVNFQRNKGTLNHKYILVGKNGKERTEIRNFAVERYKNDIDQNEKYKLDRIDGSFNKSNINEVSGTEVKISTENSSAKNWFGIIIGKANDDQNKLRGKLFAKIDSLSNE